MGREMAKRYEKIISDYFLEKKDIRLVLLYGSISGEEFRKDSDIDIAIAGERPLSLDRILDIVTDLNIKTDRNIDLIDLLAVDGLILCEAIFNGIKIKMDVALFSSLHVKCLLYNEDFLPIKRKIMDARLEEFVSEN